MSTEEEKMSYQERRTIMSMLSGLIIFAGYSIYIYQNYQEKIFSSTLDMKFWASAILIMIPVSIVARIIIHIVFAIGNAIATREEEPNITDERDKLIELKASRNSYYVFAFGFLLAMALMLFDNMPQYMLFVTLIVFGLLSEMMEGITKLYFYRRGF